MSIGPMDDSNFNPKNLDPGVRKLVAGLRSLGIPTTDSGDGETKQQGPGVLEFPHVFATYTAFTDCGLSFALSQAMDHAKMLHTILPELPEGEGIVEVKWSPQDEAVILAIIGWCDEDIGEIDWTGAKPEAQPAATGQAVVLIARETAGRIAAIVNEQLSTMTMSTSIALDLRKAAESLQLAADNQDRDILGDFRTALGYDRDDDAIDFAKLIEAAGDAHDAC